MSIIAAAVLATAGLSLSIRATEGEPPSWKFLAFTFVGFIIVGLFK